MPTKFSPKWTDDGSQTVLAPYALLYGSRYQAPDANGFLNLQGKRGGFLNIGVGRYSTAALSAGIDIIIRRVANAGAAGYHQYGTPFWMATGGTSYSNQLINNASNYAVGAQSFAFDGQAYNTAFAHGDLLCFWGKTAIPSASGDMASSFASGINMEIMRCSAGMSTPFIPDSKSRFAHNDNEYFSAADAWGLWLPGGSLYTLTFDAGAVTTTSAVFACMADLQTYDYDLKGMV